MDEEVRLSIEFKNSRPVELTGLTESLAGLSSLYARFAESTEYTINDETVHLYIKEVRTGSIVWDLVAFAATIPIIPILQHTRILVDFTKDLKVILDFFKGDVDAEDPDRPAQVYKDVSRFINPVSQDNGSQLNMSVHEGATVVVNFGMNSNDCNAAQNRIENYIAMMQETHSGCYHNQVFYWYQARDETKARSGDRGVIEAISPKPIKVLFQSETAKSAMLSDKLFKKAYIVDVEVHTINNRPKVYKILDVHEAFDRDD